MSLLIKVGLSAVPLQVQMVAICTEEELKVLKKNMGKVMSCGSCSQHVGCDIYDLGGGNDCMLVEVSVIKEKVNPKKEVQCNEKWLPSIIECLNGKHGSVGGYDNSSESEEEDSEEEDS